MPKSKRNKTVDLSKTKKHGLEGKKELYKKIQTFVEDYANVFVFAVNDMRNCKMKNVREQWRHSRFCFGKNKVMAMALGRTPEEEYRPNLHKIGQMLVGERGLLFTNQSVDEVTNWFQSYSEADFARSGNIATEDVILPEGPLEQFPHNLESYLRQLGLPTTLKKGVIHLIKEHVVCTEGERLSPETARILKLLRYEMAEFRIKILSVWSQDGSFVSLHSDPRNPESKENAVSPQKSFMREDFELAKDCLLLGDDEDEMEVAEDDSEDEDDTTKQSKKETESKKVSKNPEDIEVLEVVKSPTSNKEESRNNETVEVISSDPEDKKEVKSSLKKKGKKSLLGNVNSKPFEYLDIIPCDLEDEAEQVKSSFKKKGKKSIIEARKCSRESVEIIPLDLDETEQEKSSSEEVGKKSTIKAEEIIPCDIEENQESKQTKLSSRKRGIKSFIEAEENSGDSESIEIISGNLEEKQDQVDSDVKKEKHTVDNTSENNTNSDGKNSINSENENNSSTAIHLKTEDVEMEEIEEPVMKKNKTDSTVKKLGRKSKKTVNKETEENNEIVDSAAILKLTEKKLEESAEKPKKFSPKMTRARAAATNKKIKTPEPIETKRSARKRKM